MSLRTVITKVFPSILKLPRNYNYCMFSMRKRCFTTTRNINKSNTLKLSLIGASVGAIVGTGYSLTQLNRSNTHIANKEIILPVIYNAPKIKPSRRITIPNDESGLKLTLYQYQTCPFCCKVRAFLDYYGISYNVVEVDPVLRQSIKWSEYKKVPILLAKVNNGQQQLNDSTMIISALTSYLADDNKTLEDIIKYYPIMKYNEEGNIKSEIMNRYFLMLDGNTSVRKSKEQIADERKWRKWADDVLVHTLSPNVYRSPEESLQAFHWFSTVGGWEEHFPTWERIIIIYVGAFAMWLVGKRLKTRHNLKDDVRQSLYEQCDYWMKEIRNKGTRFMGGDEPDLSDLAVYGVLNSIEGCYAFQDLLDHSTISNWYKDMKEVVRNHYGMKTI